MSPELPAGLRAAVARELEGASRRDLGERAAKTSAAYRAGGTSAVTIKSAEDALAYALVRLPATYAACAAVFGEVQSAAADFRPRSLLDAGAGPGGGGWAALEAWPELDAITWLDSSPPFLELAARLAQGGPAALSDADARRADLTAAGPWPVADLVLASYALAEIPAPRQAAVVGALWDACEGVLALVEPGTPAGYGRILTARETLIAAGATLLAPCPHVAACPLIAPDWCHFVQRLPRSRDHRLAKGAEVPFEDEKFSYLLAARPGVVARTGRSRILAPPRAGKPGIALKLCTPAGLEARFVARRDKPAHAAARRLGWGDAWDDTA
jgi:ribosomal protein RSM22 (predicted rRNA methylase)